MNLRMHFWKFIIRSMMRAHGFIDPAILLSRINLLTQSSELTAPAELLRATSVLYARGIFNGFVIQQNLDWVWPHWVVRQFDPNSPSFIPRAFSLTNINLTHRNWTAVGLPDIEETPIVDERGLIMPFWDSWSLDCWLVFPDRKDDIVPSRMEVVSQELDLDQGLRVVTRSHQGNSYLTEEVGVVCENGRPVLFSKMTVDSDKEGSLVVSVRPLNPEGISFVKEIRVHNNGAKWKINHNQKLFFNLPPESYYLSDYHNGDVYFHLFDENYKKEHLYCPIEMITGAACFKFRAGEPREVAATIELSEKKENCQTMGWNVYLAKGTKLTIPDKHLEGLFNSALRTVLLHTAKDVYAGPYTYRRFWFRDTVFIARALLLCGFFERAERIIDTFPARQKIAGYFSSQDGEWDSNGQVLWLIAEFCRITNKKPKEEWKHMIYSGAHWIQRKRVSAKGKEPHAGLMPVGFSAEHFGPNNYYYWDDFWSVSGLNSAAYLSELFGQPETAKIFRGQAKDLNNCINKSLQKAARKQGNLIMSSSPYRRPDSASIGCLAAGYPLRLWNPNNRRLKATADYLWKTSLIHGAFFHQISHSGINPYLTLHLAQIFLRQADKRFFELMNSIASLASATGQWPEAIHPLTKCGCMGDGQHVWAAAEWLTMLRNCFVREENDKLILCSGIPPLWFEKHLKFGPAPTSFGTISISVDPGEKIPKVTWQGQWHDKEPEIEIRFLERKSQ